MTSSQKVNAAAAFRFAITILAVDLMILWLIPGSPAVYFVSFSVVACLWFMDFGGSVRERLIAYGAGTLAGTIGVIIGTLAGGYTVLAVITAFVVSTAFSMMRVLPGVRPIAAVGPQLGLLLALLIPGEPAHLWSQTLGWIVGSAIAIVAALLIFPRRTPIKPTGPTPTGRLALMDSARIGLAVSLAVLVAKLTGVEHGFWAAAVALCIASTHLPRKDTNRAAVQMTLGAVGGVAIAAAAIYLLPPTAVFVLLPIAAFWSKFDSGRNSLLVQLTYTPFAVFNLTLLSWPQPGDARSFRLEDVLIGAGVAVVATWIATKVERSTGSSATTGVSELQNGQEH